MSIPERDELVYVRSRQYLVDDVSPAGEGHAPELGDTLVRLHCVEDDALGEPLEVLWEREVDARRLGRAAWEEVGRRGEPERLQQARRRGKRVFCKRWRWRWRWR